MQERPKLKPELWFSAYNDYLYNYARLRINDNGVIGDLIQDTYLAALKSSKNFKGLVKERTWLTAILKNKIVDHYRHINSKKAGTKEIR